MDGVFGTHTITEGVEQGEDMLWFESWKISTEPPYHGFE
jgi:hypothetical protein